MTKHEKLLTVLINFFQHNLFLVKKVKTLQGWETLTETNIGLKPQFKLKKPALGL
jgi:hypothetical protein